MEHLHHLPDWELCLASHSGLQKGTALDTVLSISTGPAVFHHCLLSGEKMRQLTAKAFHYCQITTSRVAGSREETAATESARKAMLTAHGS